MKINVFLTFFFTGLVFKYKSVNKLETCFLFTSICPHCVVLSKGQVSTSHYRFLANSGGFVWAETQATVLYSSKTSQPEAIICLNFILRYFYELSEVMSPLATTQRQSSRLLGGSARPMDVSVRHD